MRRAGSGERWGQDADVGGVPGCSSTFAVLGRDASCRRSPGDAFRRGRRRLLMLPLSHRSRFSVQQVLDAVPYRCACCAGIDRSTRVQWHASASIFADVSCPRRAGVGHESPGVLVVVAESGENCETPAKRLLPTIRPLTGTVPPGKIRTIPHRRTPDSERSWCLTMAYEFDLGSYSRPVTTSSPEAQLWFDRGLLWTYGFNHEEAVFCFKQAAEADPKCAMAYWGVAYALGPNYNKPWEAFDEAETSKTLSEAMTRQCAPQRWPAAVPSGKGT